MKKFTKDDKAKCIIACSSNEEVVAKGEVVTVHLESSNGYISTDEKIYFYPADNFILFKQIPLKITKLKRIKNGVEYYTWQFSKNGKVSNHSYNGKQTRDKQLKKFIEDIQSGNFVIK